jgi:hypothetical protein
MDQKSTTPEVVRASEAPLPAERAFVVQLRAQPDPAGNLIAGRAEHIASGAAARFTSAADLIAFIAQVLAPPRSVERKGGE